MCGCPSTVLIRRKKMSQLLKAGAVGGVFAALAIVLAPGEVQAQGDCSCTCVETGTGHFCTELPPLIEHTGTPHEEERNGTCPWGGHERCELRLTEEDLNEFVEALTKAVPTTVRDVIDSVNGVAYFNAQRNAIQVKGCEEQIIANIPISGELANALTD
jgi:hypothetical protein